MKYSAILSPETQAETSRASASATSLLLIPIWFGIVTGLIEGAGLLIFQRINWAQWGRVIHVSKQILWISPLVDLLFFLILALVVWSASRLSARIPSIRVLCFLLSFFYVYYCLTLTNRLYNRACVLLAFGVAVVFTCRVSSYQSR